MAARNRPGKRERMRAAKAERMGIIAANLSSPAPVRPTFGAPRGLGNSVLARNSLHAASHDVGFVGPRGYMTPKDKLSRNEVVNPKKKEVRLGYSAGATTMEERERARELSDMVKGFDKETQRG